MSAPSEDDDGGRRGEPKDTFGSHSHVSDRTSRVYCRAMELIDGQVLSIDELRSYATRLRSDITPIHLNNIVEHELFHRAILIPGDLVIHGDLDMDSAEIQVLIVEGNLTVEGRLEDRDDEENESLLLVQGSLQATDLFTWGTLEVHGDLTVDQHLLLLDNACIAHIEGDVRANFIFDYYHHCKTHGEVLANTIVQDSPYIEAKSELSFVEPEGDDICQVLNRDILEGQDDDEDNFFAEAIDVEALTEWIRDGRSIFREVPS